MAELGDLLVKKVLEDLAEAVGQNEKLLKALGVETVPDALDEIIRLKETIALLREDVERWKAAPRRMRASMDEQNAEIARLRGECRRLMGLE